MTEQIVCFAASTVDSDGRIIGGLAVPFDRDSSPTMFGGDLRIHQFKRGAFSRSIKERLGKIRLHVEHERRQLPIGKAVELTEADDGLRSRFEIADTSAGNDALTLVRDGFVNGFSIGVSPITFREDGERIIHLEARIDEVSLVAAPAFEGASASAFSTATSGIHPDIARRRLRLIEMDLF